MSIHFLETKEDAIENKHRLTCIVIVLVERARDLDPRHFSVIAWMVRSI